MPWYHRRRQNIKTTNEVNRSFLFVSLPARKFMCAQKTKTCTHFNWLSLCFLFRFILMRSLLLFQPLPRWCLVFAVFEMILLRFTTHFRCLLIAWHALWVNLCFLFVYSCAVIFCLLHAIAIVVARYVGQNNDSICTWNWSIKMKMHTRMACKQMKWISCHSQLISFLQKRKEIKMMICVIVLFVSNNSSSSTLSQMNVWRFDRPVN